jgi:hypothetical protein
MASAIDTGLCEIQRFAFRHEVRAFQAVTSNTTQWLLTASICMTYLGPLLAVILAFIISPWWLTGVLSFVVGFKTTKLIYDSAIIRAARSSEDAFCFLFYISQICFVDRRNRTAYEWQGLKHKC